MKYWLLAITLFVGGIANAQEQHHDWEDNHVLQINREPARAYFIPFGEHQGDRTLSLNGQWHFRWTKTPDERVKDFYRTNYDDSQWATLAVPANWEVNGYGTPIYISAGYPFKIDPRHILRNLLPINQPPIHIIHLHPSIPQPRADIQHILSRIGIGRGNSKPVQMRFFNIQEVRAGDFNDAVFSRMSVVVQPVAIH